MNQVIQEKVLRDRGFSLIEMSIAGAMLSLLMVSLFGMVSRNLQAWRLEESMTLVNTALRDAETAISKELIDAALENDATAGISGIVITPGSIVFQKPLSVDGLLWSTPITIQIRNEDTDGDLLLSPGEDLDENGILDRVIERLQDGVAGQPPDGDFDDPGERRILGREVGALTYVVTGSQVDVFISCSHLVEGAVGNRYTDVISFQLYLVN